MILNYMFVYVPLVLHRIIKLFYLCFLITFGCNYSLTIHVKLLLILVWLKMECYHVKLDFIKFSLILSLKGQRSSDDLYCSLPVQRDFEEDCSVEMDLTMAGVSGTCGKQDDCWESKSSGTFSVSGDSLPFTAKLEYGSCRIFFCGGYFSKHIYRPVHFV